MYYKLSDEDSEEPTKDWAEIENKKNVTLNAAKNKPKKPNHVDTNESETEEEDNKVCK